MDSLKRDAFAGTLAMHTSAGAPPALDGFVDALAAHLPWAGAAEGAEDEEEDWFVNLQLEGASAVAAATDLMIQMQHRYIQHSHHIPTLFPPYSQQHTIPTILVLYL